MFKQKIELYYKITISIPLIISMNNLLIKYQFFHIEIFTIKIMNRLKD